MDWGKAKTILIIALIALNVFLFIVLGVFDKPEEAIEEIDLTAETAKLLETRAIDIKTEIPESPEELAVVTVERIALSESAIDRLIAREVALPQEERTEENIRLKARSFLEQLGVWNENTYISKYEIGGDGSVLLTFGSTVNGIPVELSNLYCYVSGGKIAVVIGAWMTGSETEQAPQKTISATEALLAFAGKAQRSYDADGALVPLHITQMEMVYHFDSDAMEKGLTVSDTAFPYWKFTYIVGAEEDSVNELGAKISVVTRTLYIDAYGEE